MSDADEPAPPLDAEPIVAAFNRHGVRYVTIGAFAALQQGAMMPPTQDIDFTPAAERENLQRLSAAQRDLGARIRTDAVSGGLPFNHNAESPAGSGIWNLVCPWSAPTGSSTCRFAPAGPTATTTWSATPARYESATRTFPSPASATSSAPSSLPPDPKTCERYPCCTKPWIVSSAKMNRSGRSANPESSLDLK